LFLNIPTQTDAAPSVEEDEELQKIETDSLAFITSLVDTAIKGISFALHFS
jgi:hypothetical protein